MSIILNDSKTNPRYMRILQFGLNLMNTSLFLNLFIYLYYAEGLEGKLVYMIILPWILTCTAGYAINMMFA